MKHIYLMSILLLIGLTLNACSSPGTQGNSAPEPTPPNPFPVELSAGFSVFSVDVNKQKAVNKLIIDVNRNTELFRNVVVEYRLFSFNKGEWMAQEAETILDEDIDIHIKRQITKEISLAAYGEYRVELNAEYYNWAQGKSYTIRFDNNGVSVLHEGF